MKKFSLVLLAASFVTAAPAALASEIEVGKVSISRPADGCGTRPEGPEGCATPVSVSFEAYTKGLCDVFSAVIDKSSGKAMLIIEKGRIEHCTRPEHGLSVQTMVTETVATLQADEPIYLANPLLAK